MLSSSPITAIISGLVSGAQHSLHANASWGERSRVASSINTLLSLTPCLIFSPFHLSRSLRRRLPVGGLVSPVAVKNPDRLLIACLFWNLVALFVRQPPKSCLCFVQVCFYLQKPTSGTNYSSNLFPLENPPPRCNVDAFAPRLSFLAFSQNSCLARTLSLFSVVPTVQTDKKVCI